MKKPGILAAAAALALTTGAATAGQPPVAMGAGAKIDSNFRPRAGLTVLWNQNSPNSVVVDSQNFTSGAYSSFDAAATDDFVVPAGQTWTVNEVDVSGQYFNGGSGPATSVDITFYKNKVGKKGAIDTPGTALGHGIFTKLTCTDTNGSFACTLPPYNVKKGKYLTIAAGHYWVSVVANCSFSTCGEWGWSQNSTITGDAAEWENPGNGFGTGCTTWNTVPNCGGSQYTGDFAFDLQGSSS